MLSFLRTRESLLCVFTSSVVLTPQVRCFNMISQETEVCEPMKSTTCSFDVFRSRLWSLHQSRSSSPRQADSSPPEMSSTTVVSSAS